MKKTGITYVCSIILMLSHGFAESRDNAAEKRAGDDLANGKGGEKTLLVKAWRKTGKPKEYETRILSRLGGFQRNRQPKTDSYGGWANRKFEATGFFHTRKIGDRWWMIDPEGHRFLHVAVNSVRHGSSPRNLRAFPGKFGSVEKWRDATAALLKRNGFNGTGCWSDNEIFARARDRLAYTPQWNFMSRYGKVRGGIRQVSGHMAYPGDCIFVFDPEFEAFADEHAKQLAATKDDPYLIGHFSDNEMPFPKNSLDKYLGLDEKDPGRKAANAWLTERKGSASAAVITDEDREAWLGVVANRYLGIVGRAIRKYDPNHMYLGPRFHSYEKRSPAVFAAAGRHLDAIAVNIYGVWTPTKEMLARWEKWSGKPLIATEWYAKGQDSGMRNLTGAGWTVPTQRERGWFYQNFTLGLLESKVCVGWHWFKYMDNDPENLKTDPSNRDSNKGIVRTDYEPYVPLLEAMKDLNASVYPLTEYFDK